MPGTIAPDPKSPPPAIHVIAYNAERLVEREVKDIGDLEALLAQWPVTWINVDGLGDADALQRLGELFRIHQLALEDVVNLHQRAKVEEYADHLFLVARMVAFDERLATEQVSVFLGKNYVVTFQERPGDCLGPVRERLRKKRGRIRSVGPDYLAYTILDAIIDSYFPVLEKFGDRLETLEDEIMAHARPESVARLHDTRADLMTLRRGIRPHREAVASLIRDENALISSETRIYLRDCYDHTIQILDLLETDRELCADLRELHLSSISNRMNEVMKVLTIIATIFMPLSFVAGLYGMNFNPEASPWNMPELNWPWGYPAALALMAAVAGGMLLFFWKKGWLRR